jgi:Holliday junction resolvase RusA-like endonuclease
MREQSGEMWIPFAPVAKGRPRFSKGHAYTPRKTKEYEKLIQDFVAAHHIIDKPIMGPLSVQIVLFFKADEFTYHSHKPDADNLAKSILDALGPKTYTYIGIKTMSKGILYQDDAQIAHLEVTKCCHPKQGIWLTWRKLNEVPDIIHPLERK